jgi:hypothetical protein
MLPHVGQKLASGSVSFPKTMAQPRPAGTLWSAALCTAFHYALPRARSAIRQREVGRYGNG